MCKRPAEAVAEARKIVTPGEPAELSPTVEMYRDTKEVLGFALLDFQNTFEAQKGATSRRRGRFRRRPALPRQATGYSKVNSRHDIACYDSPKTRFTCTCRLKAVDLAVIKFPRADERSQARSKVASPQGRGRVHLEIWRRREIVALIAE